MTQIKRAYESAPAQRGIDLISDSLPLGRLMWYGEPTNQQGDRICGACKILATELAAANLDNFLATQGLAGVFRILREINLWG